MEAWVLAPSRWVVLLCAVVWGGCARRLRTAMQPSRDAVARVDLLVTETEPGHYRVEVDARLGDRAERLLLDSGAVTTTLVYDDASARYGAVRVPSRRASRVWACRATRSSSTSSPSVRCVRRPSQPSAAARRGRATSSASTSRHETLEINLPHRSLLVRKGGSSRLASEHELVRLKAGHVTIAARLR